MPRERRLKPDLPRWISPECPVDLGSRRGRILALGAAAQSLLAGRPLDSRTAVYLGAALSSWLNSGGSLSRDFLKVDGPAGSHATPEGDMEE